jgi:hypothetical protein
MCDRVKAQGCTWGGEVMCYFSNRVALPGMPHDASGVGACNGVVNCFDGVGRLGRVQGSAGDSCDKVGDIQAARQLQGMQHHDFPLP